MKSILDALKDGRLIELPDNAKEQSLRYLASIIEAIPDITPGVDIAEAALTRESAASTALGMGWACPHVRVPGEGELFCAIGWSPAGINYGAPDGKPVNLLVMFYIPDSQKNAYLKEVSSLAKAILKEQGMDRIMSAAGINEVRDQLLNWVSAALDSSAPEAKARIIKLEARQASASGPGLLMPQAISQLIPLSIVKTGDKSVVLTQQPGLAVKLEESGLASALINSGGNTSFEAGGYRVFIRSKTAYHPDRAVYECFALKS